MVPGGVTLIVTSGPTKHTRTHREKDDDIKEVRLYSESNHLNREPPYSQGRLDGSNFTWLHYKRRMTIFELG